MLASGLLRIEQLYAVAFLAGVMTLLFDSTATTLVPTLVGRENLVPASSAWFLNVSVAGIVGPSLAGVLVQLLTAPLTIAFDAVSFLHLTCSGEVEHKRRRWQANPAAI